MKKDILEKRKQLLAGETGTVFKDHGGRLSICLVYPNTYHVGMSNLGLTGLYTLLNQRDDVVCERAFLPDAGDLKALERSGKSLCSLESGRPLNRFDVIGFSVSFENDYPNVVRMLSLAKVRPRSAGRGGRDPLVIMGGPCAFMNPEPLADFMDAVFVGEAEEMLGEFIEVVKRKQVREEMLGALTAIEGVYVPTLYEPRYNEDGTIAEMRRLRDGLPARVRRRYVRDLDASVLTSCVAAADTEFGTMALIEAMRGCPFSCRFCAAGHIYNPPRQRSLSVLEREAARAAAQWRRVGLIAPSLTEYRDIRPLLALPDVHFSITSLRASRQSAGILDLMKDKNSVSIAPEAGSQRLRDVINKKITEEDILSTAGLILERGVRTLRLYFMVGLPTETDDDIRGLIGLTRKIRALSRRGMIALTISTFVPKPFTPFQWHPMADAGVVKARLTAIKKGLSTAKGVNVGHDSVKDAGMQCLFAMGDRRVAAVLERMAAGTTWQSACRDAGIDPAFFIYRRRNFGETLPWDFIDCGLAKDGLIEEHMKAVG